MVRHKRKAVHAPDGEGAGPGPGSVKDAAPHSIPVYFSPSLRALDPSLARPLSVPTSSFEAALDLLKARYFALLAGALHKGLPSEQRRERSIETEEEARELEARDRGQKLASAFGMSIEDVCSLFASASPHAAEEELRAAVFRGSFPRLQAEMDFLIEQLRNHFFPWISCARCGRWRRLPSWEYLHELRRDGAFETWKCELHPRRRIPCRLQQEPWRAELYWEGDPSRPLRGEEVLRGGTRGREAGRPTPGIGPGVALDDAVDAELAAAEFEGSERGTTELEDTGPVTGTRGGSLLDVLADLGADPDTTREAKDPEP